METDKRAPCLCKANTPNDERIYPGRGKQRVAGGQGSLPPPVTAVTVTNGEHRWVRGEPDDGLSASKSSTVNAWAGGNAEYSHGRVQISMCVCGRFPLWSCLTPFPRGFSAPPADGCVTETTTNKKRENFPIRLNNCPLTFCLQSVNGDKLYFACLCPV